MNCGEPRRTPHQHWHINVGSEAAMAGDTPAVTALRAMLQVLAAAEHSAECLATGWGHAPCCPLAPQPATAGPRQLVQRIQ